MSKHGVSIPGSGSSARISVSPNLSTAAVGNRTLFAGGFLHDGTQFRAPMNAVYGDTTPTTPLSANIAPRSGVLKNLQVFAKWVAPYPVSTGTIRVVVNGLAGIGVNDLKVDITAPTNAASNTTAVLPVPLGGLISLEILEEFQYVMYSFEFDMD